MTSTLTAAMTARLTKTVRTGDRRPGFVVTSA